MLRLSGAVHGSGSVVACMVGDESFVLMGLKEERQAISS